MKKICVLDGNEHGKIICKIIRELAPQDCIVELFTVVDKGGHCTNDKLCEGLVYALFGGFDIVNISLGLDYMSETVDDIINKLCNKGVIVVCASGNNHSCFPAKHPRTISVGASDEYGNKTDYTVEGSYNVLRLGTYECNGKRYEGTSFSCARYVAELAWR